MAAIEPDEHHWPLVTLKFPSHFSDEEFDDYLTGLSVNLQRTIAQGTRTGLLFDTSDAPSVDARTRRKMADWIDGHREQSAEYCAGYAFVIRSGIVRGILTAILWLAPMPAPHVVVATREEGFEWLRKQLAQHGIEVSGASATFG